MISNTNTVKAFPDAKENRKVKSVNKPTHHSNRSDRSIDSSQDEDDSQTSDNLNVDKHRSQSKNVARLKTRSTKKP